uniref:mitogen-activated protein kinase kinase kinase n=1 Tax=Meloidogyne javanica TaxID=6303 RepID=A0A915MT97_MELJA
MSCDGLIIYLAHSYIEYYTDIFCELFCEHFFFYKPAAYPPDKRPNMKEPAKYANDKTLPSTSINEQRPDVKMRKIRRVGTTCWDYQAKEKDELSFRHGSVVEILNDESCEDGWVMARIDKKKGMVPGNYVVLVGTGPNLINSEDVKRGDLLASGGFANVFKGSYKNQEVALKIPKSSTEDNREDLEREALILSRIKHENIVGFFGYSLDPLLIALELCRGGALINLYRRMASSDILTVICWAKQVASAIQHLHSRDDPVIYADLKAENEIPCLCGLDDESWKIVTNYTKNNCCRKCKGLRIDLITLKISDFNVSKNGTLIKNDESCDGSVPWMSPEVLECNGVTTMIDVWSFANFLWELLSRKIPYKNQGIYTIRNFMKNDLPLPLPDDLPLEMRKIFESCWKKIPVERSPIKDVIEMLDVAELNIDNNYKWILPKEQPEETFKNNQILNDQSEEMLNCLQINSSGESFKIPIYEAIMLIQRYGTILPKELNEMKKLGIELHPPTPAKRLKKSSKLNKESIGPPINFRHNVSARVRSSSSDDKSFSDEKILVIHR